MATISYTVGTTYDPNNNTAFALDPQVYTGTADNYQVTVGQSSVNLTNLSNGLSQTLSTGASTFSVKEDFSDNTGTVNLNGGDNGDVLRGGAGDDTLNGGAGDDVLEGGLGANTIIGGTGANVASYQHFNDGSSLGVLAYFATSKVYDAVTDGNELSDTLTGILYVRGSAFSDIIVGANQYDVLQGGGGADTIVGRGNTDHASFLNSPQGVSINLMTGVYSGGDAQGDTLLNIQNLDGSYFTDSLTGNDNANQIVGHGGADSIFGLGGDDRISITATPSMIDGGTNTSAGFDNLVIQPGSTVTLSDANFTGIERVTSYGGTTLDMSGVTADIPSLINSTSTAATGGATIIGTQGNDRIQAGSGGDSITGGLGNDTLLAGAGADTFHYNSLGFGRDSINYIDTTQDHLDLSGVASGTAAVTFKQSGSGANATTTITINGDKTDSIALHGVTTAQAQSAGFIQYGPSGNASAVRPSAPTGAAFKTDGMPGAKVDTAPSAKADTTSPAGPSTTASISYTVGTSFDINNNTQLSLDPNVYTGAADSYQVSVGTSSITLSNLSNNETQTFQVNTSVFSVQEDFSSNIGAVNLSGGDYGDNLAGGAGNDVLYGGGGNDDLQGGLGTNTVDGGAGTNSVSYKYFDDGSSLGVLVYLGAQKAFDALTDGSELSDSLSNIQQVRGSAFSDILVGTPGTQLNVIEGGGGADTVVGGGNGHASFYNSPQGVTINLATNVNTGGDAQGDKYYNIQSLDGSRFADSLTGNDNANTIVGHGGADSIYGLGGDDRITISETPTMIDGGTNTATGFDNLVVQAGSTVTLSDSNFTGIERVTASGGGMVDMSGVSAAGDVPTLINSTSTAVTGGATIIGTQGNDRIQAGDGGDSITGGLGNDTLLAGAGSDTFHYNSLGFGRDLLSYVDTTLDHLDLGRVASSSAALSFKQSGSGSTLTTTIMVNGDKTDSIVLRGVTAAQAKATGFIEYGSSANAAQMSSLHQMVQAMSAMTPSSSAALTPAAPAQAAAMHLAAAHA